MVGGTKVEGRTVVEFDGAEVQVPREQVTGVELLAALGVPASTGLLEIMEDGTQRQVRQDDRFDLGHGAKFKKRPKFKRG